MITPQKLQLVEMYKASCKHLSKYQPTNQINTSLVIMQLHCASWDSYSNRYVCPSADSTSSMQSWSPEAIMKDFEKDGFLKMIDELNQTIELMSFTQ